MAAIVRASFDGQPAIDDLLAHGAPGVEPPEAPRRSAPVGAYITSVEVEGFRGIGERARLELTPGPGLTLVIGRNGSGKSSFAEALEVLLTGDNPRWAKRSAVWREGWRNLHHPETEIAATLAVEGVPGETTVRRTWRPESGLDNSHVEVQPHGLPKTGLDFLGWDAALPMYRPFLSYSELGSMFDEGPTKLHDAVSSVLGLDELTAAEKALREARLARERAVKQALGQRDELVALLHTVDDERARQAAVLLAGKAPPLEPVERIVTAAGDEQASGELGLFRRVLGLQSPDPAAAASAAEEIRAAHEAVHEHEGTAADAMLRSADLLEQALDYVDRFPTEACPVCATPDVLTDTWAERTREAIEEQRRTAQIVQRERRRLADAVQSARDLLGAVPAAVRDSSPLLDIGAVVEAWRPWVELLDESDPLRLANGLDRTVGPLARAVSTLKAQAEQELERRQDAWRPAATTLAGWIAEARPAFAAASHIDELKQAEAWLKSASAGIRNQRFAPIADESMEIWKLLRQSSNVSLGRIELMGSGTQRKVTLDVTIDGVPGAALGVMSQGELHALALSLFFPRATLDESPFRFVVVDDPVQSMDPSKVDGLAKVLEQAAQTRQVIVLTHDDRLPEAIRRLGIDARVIEVARSEKSVVELRTALTPVERYIQDARALTSSDELPEEVARRVVGGFCRFAVEAACIEAVRRRRIGRGDTHADVERLLERSGKLGPRVALALFDDGSKTGSVLTALNNKFGRRAGDVFQAINRGAHEPVPGDLRDLVRDSAVLARQLADVT